MPTDEQLRERFEAEWKRRGGHGYCNLARAEGNYVFTPVQRDWDLWREAYRSRDAEVQALERVALNVMASLDAALSILGRSHEGKVPANEAVASDRMFTMMLDDYQKSLDAARAALAGGETGETE